jgi:hypothetical protein
MPISRSLFPFLERHAPDSPYVYTLPKRRRWPMVAAFGVGWVCALVLPGSQSQSPRGDTEKSITYLNAKASGLRRTSDVAALPAGRQLQAPADTSQPAPDNPQDALLAMPGARVASEAAGAEPTTANVQTGIAPWASRTRLARAAPVRAKIHIAHSIAKRHHASGRSVRARAIRRHEAPMDRMVQIYQTPPSGYSVPVYRSNGGRARQRYDEYAKAHHGSFAGGRVGGWLTGAN